MTNTDKILAEFDEKFGKFEFLHKSGNTWDENPFKDFLETSITQALAEEKERVVGAVKKANGDRPIHTNDLRGTESSCNCQWHKIDAILSSLDIPKK